jgi:hypothetical protein
VNEAVERRQQRCTADKGLVQCLRIHPPVPI